MRSSKRTCMKAPSLPLHWVKQLPEPCNAYRTPIENAGLMGVPIPAALTKAVDVLRQRAEEEQKRNGT